MKNVLQKSLLIALLFIGALSMSLKAAGEKFIDDDIAKKMPLLAGATSSGRDYWFSIPPCYEDTPGQNFVRCFCVSPGKNKITIEIPGRGKYETRSVLAGGLTVFDLSPGDGQPFLHTFGEATPPAQIYRGLGIHIFSDNPFVLYCMVRFKYTSDGMLCLPTNGLGKEYIAGPYTSSFWPGLVAWTLVTAAYDNTKVTYTMGGDGISTVETTSKSLVAGQSVNFSLQKGDVWVVGAQKNFMDIAGSKIVANKPVAVNTGIHCANIPLEVYACDYNCEMEMPTETWGKALLIPVCHDRSKPGIIRIFAKYPNTDVFRDGNYAFTIKTSGGTRGTGYVEERATPLNDARSPFPVVYTANKPISIMYYNPGTTDDAQQVNTDPFQMLITPVEQYQSDIMFAAVNAAGGEKMSFSFMNICYELNDAGFMSDDLEFGIWNGSKWVYKKLANYDGADKRFNIPVNGKRYGMKNIAIPRDGVFRMRSVKGYKFGCYGYGFDYYDSYGFPTSTALAALEIKDTICPMPLFKKDCDGTVSNGTVTDRPDDPATRSNLSDAYMITDPDSSYNYTFKISEIISGETITANWKLFPIDPLLDSRAVLVFKDRAGNDTMIVIENFATKLMIYKDQSFGNFKPADAPITKDFWLKNESKKTVNVTQLKLLRNNVGFTMAPSGWTIPTIMKAKDSLLIKITFTPEPGLLNSGAVVFMDSLGVGDTCQFDYRVEVKAGIGEPEILVDDYDFGTVNVDDKNKQNKTLRITNTSKGAVLAITGFTTLRNPEFTTDLPTQFPNLSKANPLVIGAGKTKDFTVYFKPTIQGKYKDTIIFSSDARITDSLCIIEGVGIKSALKVNSYDWGEHKIDRPSFPVAGTMGKDVNGDDVFTLVNSGTLAVTVDNISISEGKLGDAKEFMLEDGSPLSNISSVYTSIIVPPASSVSKKISFQPKTTGPHKVEITFGNQANIAGVICTVQGVGIVPRLMITSVVNFGRTIVKDNANPTKNDVLIYNPDKTTNTNGWIYGDTVTITSLNTNNEISSNIALFGTNGFRYDGKSILDEKGNKLSISALKPYKLAPGDTLLIKDAEFVAQSISSVTSQMDVVCDADPANSNTNSLWSGSGFIQTIATATESKSTCVGSPVKINLVISNTSTSTDINTKYNLSNFALSNPQYLTFDGGTPTAATLFPNSSRTITLTFAPTADLAKRTVQLTFTSDMKVSNNNQSIDFDIDSYSFKGSTTSAMYNVTSNQIMPIVASKIDVQQQVGYIIKFNTGATIAKANVTTFDVKIKYFGTFLGAILDKTAMADANKYSLAVGKDFVGKVTIDANTVASSSNTLTQEKTITFTMNTVGGAALDGIGELVNLRFNSFLPAYTTANSNSALPKDPNGNVVYSTTITHSLSDGNNLCFDFDTATPTLIQLNPVCAAGIRPVVLGNAGAYELQAINPNPVSGAGGMIKFNVAVEGNTELRIINSAGQAISIPVSSVMKEGSYEVPIPVQDLGSGTYFVEFKSGFFTDTKQLIIQK